MEGSVSPFINFDCVEKLSKTPGFYPLEILIILEEARTFLNSFDWFFSIEDEYLGDFFDGIVGIFLFRISPKFVGVDDFVWVIIGDLPSAYITVDDCPNPATALDGYIGSYETMGFGCAGEQIHRWVNSRCSSRNKSKRTEPTAPFNVS